MFHPSQSESLLNITEEIAPKQSFRRPETATNKASLRLNGEARIELQDIGHPSEVTENLTSPYGKNLTGVRNGPADGGLFSPANYKMNSLLNSLADTKGKPSDIFNKLGLITSAVASHRLQKPIEEEHRLAQDKLAVQMTDLDEMDFEGPPSQFDILPDFEDGAGALSSV